MLGKKNPKKIAKEIVKKQNEIEKAKEEIRKMAKYVLDKGKLTMKDEPVQPVQQPPQQPQQREISQPPMPPPEMMAPEMLAQQVVQQAQQAPPVGGAYMEPVQQPTQEESTSLSILTTAGEIISFNVGASDVQVMVDAIYVAMKDGSIINISNFTINGKEIVYYKLE